MMGERNCFESFFSLTHFDAVYLRGRGFRGYFRLPSFFSFVSKKFFFISTAGNWRVAKGIFFLAGKGCVCMYVLYRQNWAITDFLGKGFLLKSSLLFPPSH